MKESCDLPLLLSIFSSFTFLTSFPLQTNVHQHTIGQASLIPEKSISSSFQLTRHPAALMSQFEPLQPVDAHCRKKRVQGRPIFYIMHGGEGRMGVCPVMDSNMGFRFIAWDRARAWFRLWSDAHCLIKEEREASGLTMMESKCLILWEEQGHPR